MLKCKEAPGVYKKSSIPQIKSKGQTLNRASRRRYDQMFPGPLPHDLQAEQSVLGAIFFDNDALDKATEIITSHNFYHDAHRKMFLVMEKLRNQNAQIDLVTLIDILLQKGLLDQCGGIPSLLRLTDVTPTAANVCSYARIVKEKALRRSMIKAGYKIISGGFEEKEPADEYIEKAESLVFQVSLANENQNFLPISEVIPSIDSEVFSETERIGIKTYFPDLDRKIGVITNHSIIVISAFTGEGKSTLIWNMVDRFVSRTKRPVFIWSGEMSKEECTLRAVCTRAKVDSTKVLAKTLNHEEKERFRQAEGELYHFLIIIDDTGGITVDELRSKVRRCKSLYPDLAFVVIDNLPLMSYKDADNEAQRIRNTVAELKAFNLQIGVPFFILTQYSYQIRKSANRRPQNDDIIGSSAVMQTATHVWRIFSSNEVTEKYSPHAMGSAFHSDENEVKLLILCKQRYGPLGEIPLLWHKKYTRFGQNWAGEPSARSPFCIMILPSKCRIQSV